MVDIREEIRFCDDNKGATFDQYTVYFNDGTYLGMSDNPTHPQGFSQWGEGYATPDDVCDFADLPEHIQTHAISRFYSE